MKIIFNQSIRSIDRPSGAAHILIAAMLFTFIVMAAMTVDVAYMQLIRTELRTATDAAAKAGVEALIRTQNATAAKAAAVQYASLNKVGGQPFIITESDVTLGRVADQSNGSWAFTANLTPYNSVRVNARIGNGGATAAKPMFFALALGQAPFATASQATASEQEVEICLCIDRSGSMMFDMSGINNVYPSPNPLLYPASRYPSTYYQNYCSPPQTIASRWAVMRSAVNTFLNEASLFQYPPRTALVTWSSAMTLPYYPFTSYTLVDTDFNLPAVVNYSWATNRASIENSIATRSAKAIGGGTTLSAGLDRAVQVLSGPNGRPLSKKVIILLTDGLWNAGRDPVLAAQDAAAAGITIHCVSMLTSTQAILTQVASITGGRYYPTTDAAQLQQAFINLARSLPIVLTN